MHIYSIKELRKKLHKKERLVVGESMVSVAARTGNLTAGNFCILQNNGTPGLGQVVKS